MITVAFTVSGQRPGYLRAALDSWADARGVQDARLLLCSEPVPDAFDRAGLEQFIARSFPSSAVQVNEGLLGCSLNTRAAVHRAFADGAEFAVLAEEDVLVSADVLEYFTWASDYFKYDGRVMAVCAHVFRCNPGALASDVVQADWFSPLVWGTWLDRWDQFLRPQWSDIPEDAWDARLRQLFRARGYFSVFPHRSRSLHIGQTSTLIYDTALSEHFYQQSISRCFQPDYPPQSYRLTARPSGDLTL